MTIDEARNKHNVKYPDIEVFECSLNRTTFMSIFRGGFSRPNPQLYMDQVVFDYADEEPCVQFHDIFKDNPWERILIFNFNDITGFEPGKESLDYFKASFQQIGTYLRHASMDLIIGGLHQNDVKSYLNYVVYEEVKHRLHNEFVCPDNAYLRVLLYDINNIDSNEWRNYGEQAK